MKLLIGTINALVLWDNGEQKTIREGNYYGLTWNNDTVFCSCNPPHENISEIQRFSKSLEYIDTLPIDGLDGVHQICYSEGRLFVANTKLNEIAIIDIDTWRKLRANWTEHNEDKHHVNSVWANGRNLWFVESGLGGIPPTVQLYTKEFRHIQTIELPEAKHIHNVYCEKDYVYSCAKGGIVRYNLITEKSPIVDIRQDKENGFFRGLARTVYHWFIGESQLQPREKRSFGDAEILVLDNGFEIVDIIQLKDTGQVQDIRVIDELDLAHNGIRF